jgi:hypothetical protein
MISIRGRRGDLSPADPDDDTPAVAGPSRRGWSVRVDPAELRLAQVNDELQIKLGRRYVLPNFDNYRDRIEVETHGTSVLTAESGQPRNLREWIDIAHACQDLLSLASYSPCAVLRLTLTTEKGVHESDNTARKEVHLFIDNVVKGEPDVEGMTPWRMLFNLADVELQRAYASLVRDSRLTWTDVRHGAWTEVHPRWLPSSTLLGWEGVVA